MPVPAFDVLIQVEEEDGVVLVSWKSRELGGREIVFHLRWEL
jgi:hypothetical protein